MDNSCTMQKHAKRLKPNSFAFSGPARHILMQKVQEHEKALRSLSTDLARRCHSDSVSAEYVRRASERLELGFTKKGELLVAFGSILLGGALDHLLSAVSTNSQITCEEFSLTFLFGVVGAYIMAYGGSRQ